MKLYEITNDFQKLFDEFENLTDNEELTEDEKSEMEQAWFDTLEGIECEFINKAENVAAYIKLIKAQAEMLKQEEAKLSARRKQKENRAENLKAYLLESMKKVNLSKIDTPMALLSIRNNAESAVVEDVSKVIEWAEKHADDILRYKAPEISKTELKRLIQSGVEVPCAHLARTQSLIIK